MPHLSLPVRGELKLVPSIGGIAAAAVAVFVADWLTPLGVLVFILYVPLCLACLWLAGERPAVFMVGFCSVLMILGLLLSPPGVPFVWAVFNRSMGLASLWGALWAGVAFGRYTGQLADALRQSEQEQKAIAARERTRAQQLKQLSEVSLALSGDPGDVFEQAVRVIGELFDVRVVCLSEIVGQELKFKAVYVKGQVFRDAGGCPLDITPCATVEQTKDLRVFERVMDRFPQASFLQDHQAYAYCGFPALDGEGHVVAVTCLLDDKPRAFTEEDQALLRAFGQRIAAEVERSRHLAERKQAEVDNARLAAIVESSDDGIISKDLNGIVNSWNASAERLFGYTAEEMVGRSIMAIIPPDCMEEEGRILAGIGRGERIESFDSTRLRKGGEAVEVSVVVSPIKDAAGCVIGAATVVRDITDRKKAETAYRQALVLLRNVVDASPDFIFAKDRGLRTILCNKAFARALGKDPEEMIGRTDIENGWDPDLVHGNQAKGIQGFEVDDRAVLSGEVIHNPYDPANVGDEVRVFDTYKVPLSAENGGVVGVLGISRDVTDRINMEKTLQHSEARLKEAQHLAQLGNWELDLMTNQLFWSDEIFRIFEIDKSRFSASYEGFLNAIHPDDRAMVNEAYTQSVQHRTPYVIVHRLLMQDGRVKHVMERGETFYDAQGQPRRSAGTVQDITVQRMAELQTKQALQEKEILLREIHHRVKNNLQLVSSLLYFQSKKVRNDEDLAVIRELQDRITSMILVHEKLYRSGDLAHIVFGDYMRALAESIGRSYERMRGKVTVLVDAQPVTLPVEVALPVGLIVNELLTNAFKYAFPDDSHGEVRVRVMNGTGRVEIAVEDTGVGLPAGFDLRTAATFGMQLMRGLAAQVGGTITFESGRGTAVRLTVPLPEGAAR